MHATSGIVTTVTILALICLGDVQTLVPAILFAGTCF